MEGTRGPEFPLDEDLVAELAPYPGELPQDSDHYWDLLTAIRRSQS
jgi:hypothetical protein